MNGPGANKKLIGKANAYIYKNEDYIKKSLFLSERKNET